MDAGGLLFAFVACGTIGLMASPQGLSPDVLRVARAENTNREFLKRTPAFTCLETIDRQLAIRKHRKIQKLDAVQVEVGVGAAEEVYSWPGQHRFSASNLPELVGHGFVATGMFKVFAANLFVHRAGSIRFIGPEFVQGRSALHFTYTISGLKNSWDITWRGASGSAGEAGEFWVDSSDYTLLRLTVNAVDISPSIPLSSLRVVIDYQLTMTAEGKALLPILAQIDATEINGDLHQNRVFFSHCHVFSSTSVLLASAEDLGNAISRYELSRKTLPGGLALHLKLLASIDSLSATVGDTIIAELEHAIHLPDGDTIPAGALVKGFVREFQRIELGEPSYAVGLEFDEIDWANHAAEFLGKEVTFDRLNGLRQTLSRNEMVHNRTTFQTNTETFTPPAIPGVATFLLTGDHVRLPRGFHMLWETEQRPHTP